MSEVLSRLRLFVVAVLCLASLSRAQVTLVQQASQNTPTSGSCGSQPSSESKTLTVTPGNTLVLFWFQTTDAFRNVTGGGVQWRQAAYVSGNTEMGIYYGLNSTGGVQTITVNWANTPVNCAFSIAEFSGVPNPTVVATQRLQLLLPGETAAPGTASGKTGVPLTHVAGSTFNVTVNATDSNWNVIPTATPMVHLAPNELTATMPADTALVGGTATLPVRYRVSNTAATLVASEASPGLEGSAVTAAPVDGGSSTAVTGTLVTTSGPELLMAVSVHPVVTGPTGIPTGGFNALAGVTSPGTTSVVQEAAWLEAMSPGAYNTSWLYPSNTKWTALIAAFGTPTRYGADGSTPIVITVGAATKLQVLLPGETAAPGTTTGKTGTPNGQGQGVPFTVVVNLVDANWNVVSSTDVVSLTSTDSTAALPANGPLVAGTTTRTVTLNTAGSQTLTVSDVTNVARTANTSAAITVGAAFAASGGCAQRATSERREDVVAVAHRDGDVVHVGQRQVANAVARDVEAIRARFHGVFRR
jgi:hypothetical protein